MASPSTANLNGRPFASQAPLANDFQALDTQEPVYFDAKLLSLDQRNLWILQVIGAAEGIAAKEIGQKVNLSRYAALQRAKKLVESGFLVSQSISSTKTGIKPALYFFLAPIVSKEAIRAAIHQVGMSQLDSAADTEVPSQNGLPAPEELTQPTATPPSKRHRRCTRADASVSTTNESTKGIQDVVDGSEEDSIPEPSLSYPESSPDAITCILEALRDLMQEFIALQERSTYLENRVMYLEHKLKATEVRDRVNLDELLANIRLNR